MPTPTSKPAPRLRPSLIRLDAPGWLRQAVQPWRIEAAALWRSGNLMLELRSDRAKIPVTIELGERGSLPRISILDARISSERGASFTRALASSLARTTALRHYLERLAALAERLAGAPDDSELGRLIQAWAAWPERDADPARPLPDLPADIEALSLSRGARAALILHRLARAGSGDVIAALSAWSSLRSPDGRESESESGREGFVEQLVDAVMLGLLGHRGDALEQLARAETTGPRTAAEQLAIARAYEVLEQREAAIAAHTRVLALRGSPWDHLRLARTRGDFGPGEPVPRPDPAAALHERVSFVRQVLTVLEMAGRYDDMLALINELLDGLSSGQSSSESPPLDLSVRAATLHLWRRELGQAHARLDALGPAHAEDEQVTWIRGALAVLDGDGEAALAWLDRSHGNATALERLLWRAEAHMLLGQDAQAQACVDEHVLRKNSLVAYLLEVLIYARTKTAAQLADSLVKRTFFDALVLDVLPSLCSPERIAAAGSDPAGFAGLIREILDAMGGNRGDPPTWCRTNDAGAPRLERVVVRPSGRDAAVAQLVQIRTEPPDQVLAGFAEVVATYPKSPHPWTYRGELLIWLGRYQDALASFDEADARAPTRWSFVGRAAAYDLIGESELADHWTLEGIQKFGELETATTNVYRGERLRKLEDWPAAKQDLEIAVAVKTRRIGARINLALTYRALGDEAGWQRELARLQDDAPALLWEVGVGPDRPADAAMLLRALELMVGNRSSFLHTIIDGEGRFRVVPEPGRWVAFARLCAALARPEIEAEIAARWLQRDDQPGKRT